MVTSYHFLYSVFTISSVLPLTQTWPTPEQQVFWTSVLVSLNGVFLFDAYPGRRLVTAVSGIGVLNMSVVMGLTYFGFYQVDLADVPLLGGQVSARNRLLGAQVICIIYYIRFSVQTFRYPHRFVTIPGVELCSVRSAEAFTLLRVGEGTKSVWTRHKVAAAPDRSDSALEKVTNALRAAAAHSGPDSFGALRRELELLYRECATDCARRRTLDIGAELRQSARESCRVVMLLPVFRTTVVDETDTLGAALKFYTLSPVSSPVAVLVQCASWPLSFALTVAALLGTIPTRAALTITSLSTLSSALRLLQGNKAILRLLVRSFDLWLAFGYAVFAGASGCVALASTPDLALLWCLSQTLLPLLLLYDSMPASSGAVGMTHRCSFFPAYLIFCAACTGLLHTGRFPGGGEVIRVFGIAQSPTQGCLSAHLVLFFSALRYVYRVIRSSDDLVSVRGLRKTRLAMSEARLLQAAALNARSNGKRYSFGN